MLCGLQYVLLQPCLLHNGALVAGEARNYARICIYSLLGSWHHNQAQTLGVNGAGRKRHQRTSLSPEGQGTACGAKKGGGKGWLVKEILTHLFI